MAPEIKSRYMDVPEMAAYTKSTEGAVRQKVHEKKIPYLKYGARILFDRQVIDEFLASKRVPAAA